MARSTSSFSMWRRTSRVFVFLINFLLLELDVAAGTISPTTSANPPSKGTETPKLSFSEAQFVNGLGKEIRIKWSTQIDLFRLPLNAFRCAEKFQISELKTENETVTSKDRCKFIFPSKLPQDDTVVLQFVNRVPFHPSKMYKLTATEGNGVFIFGSLGQGDVEAAGDIIIDLAPAPFVVNNIAEKNSDGSYTLKFDVPTNRPAYGTNIRCQQHLELREIETIINSRRMLQGFENNNINCSFVWQNEKELRIDFVDEGFPFIQSFEMALVAHPIFELRQKGEMSYSYYTQFVRFNQGNLGEEYILYVNDVSICDTDLSMEVIPMIPAAQYPIQLTYVWRIFPNPEEFIETLYENETTDSFLRVPASLLFQQLNISERWSLSRTLRIDVIVQAPQLPTQYQLIAFMSQIISFSDEPSIPFSIDGVVNGGKVVRKITDTITFKAETNTLSSTCIPANFRGIIYQWLVLDENGAPLSLLFSSEKTFSRPAIDLILAAAATQTITDPFVNSARFLLQVQAKPQSNPESISSIEFELEILFIPIVVLIGGSSTTVEAGKEVVLDSRGSCNPNLIPDCDPVLGYAHPITNLNEDPLFLLRGLEPQRYSGKWSCISENNCTGVPDFTNFAFRAVLSFLDGLPVGKYTFRYEITDILGSTVVGFAEQTIDVVDSIAECYLPEVKLRVPSNILANEGTPLVLYTEVERYHPDPALSSVELIWTSDNGLFDNVPESKRNSPSIQLLPNALIGGSSYLVTLSASSSCNGGIIRNVETQITLRVNSAPRNGVLVIEPLRGFAGKDKFTLQTSGWFDEEGDYPLSYSFEYVFRNEGENDDPNFEYLKGDTQRLLEDKKTHVRKTILPLNPIGQKIVVISVATDTLGASSRRLASNTFDNITLSNPFLDDSGAANSESLQAASVRTELSNLVLSGLDERVSKFCNQWATVLNEIQEFGDGDSLLAAKDLRKDCISATLDIVDFKRNKNSAPEEAAQTLSSLESLTQKVEQIDEQTCRDLVSRVDEIINATEVTLNTLKNGNNDPFSAGRIPGSLSPSSVKTLSNLYDCLRNYTESESVCQLVQKVRGSLETLARIENSAVTSGTDAKVILGNSIGLSATRQDSNAIGSLQSSFGIPGQSRQVSLPRGLGLNDSAPVPINIVIISWGSDLRCDRISGILDNTSSGCNNNSTYDYDGPQNDGIGKVLSVDVLGFDSAEERYPVKDLNESITIHLDAPLEVELDYDCGKKITAEIKCGAFNEVLGDWDTSGCEVVSIEGDGSVVCACNHLTDFAAWKAFKEDVSFTTTSTIDKLSLLAVMIIGVLLPLLYVFALCSCAWAYKKDKADAENIHKTMLTSLIIHKIMRANKKRLFFQKLKEHVNEGGQLEKLEKANVQNEGKSLSWCRRFLLALRFEHSVAGIARFDPHYTRAQRVAVFFAVIFANLFVASILFELKDADDLSIGFLLVIVFVSAILISIPVKLVIKLLFKTSANRVGSRSDIAANLFTLVERIEKDGRPESEEERKLIDAYKEVVLANIKFKRAEYEARQLRKSQRALDKNLVTNNNTGYVYENENENENNTIGVEIDNSDQTQQAVFDARQEWLRAKENVNAATLSAKTHWRDRPTMEALARVDRIRRQKSVLMKFAAIIGDTPHSVGKTRKSLLKSYCVYVGWLVLFAFYIGATYYIVKFAALRAAYADDRPESYYIIYWLLTAAVGILVSYLIAEPIISLCRYVFFPYCVMKWGSKNREDKHDSKFVDADTEIAVLKGDENHNESMDGHNDVEAPKLMKTESGFINHLRKNKRAVGESKEHILFDMLADLVETIF